MNDTLRAIRQSAPLMAQWGSDLFQSSFLGQIKCPADTDTQTDTETDSDTTIKYHDFQLSPRVALDADADIWDSFNLVRHGLA